MNVRESVSVYEDPNWKAIEFQKEELSTSGSIVARGQFWTSYDVGQIRPLRDLPQRVNTMVMIKSCQQNAEEMCCKGLKVEMNVLHDVGHVNIVRLIGYCGIEVDQFCKLQLVFDYCSNGNLKKVLQRGRSYFDGGTYCPRKIITLEVLSPGIYLNFCGWHLLKWTTEIARGMEYLAFKGIIHGDLAARNILLTCDWTAKIGNFGISQRHKLQEFSYASELQKQVLPLAWMAPETIKNLTFSELSDVWSYAVVLWEIYTLGDVPFRNENVENDLKFVEKLSQGVRPPKAEHANKNIWDLISSCWSFEPLKRPTFSKIKNFLERTVLLTKSQWDAKLSFSSQSGCDDNNVPKKIIERKPKKKSVAFAPPVATGNLLKKCVCAVDDVLNRHGR